MAHWLFALAAVAADLEGWAARAEVPGADAEAVGAALLRRVAGTEQVWLTDRRGRTLLVRSGRAGDGREALHVATVGGAAREVPHRRAAAPLCAAALSPLGGWLAHGRVDVDGACEVEIVPTGGGPARERLRLAGPWRTPGAWAGRFAWTGEDDFAAVVPTDGPPGQRVVLRRGGAELDLFGIGEPDARVTLQHLDGDLIVTTRVRLRSDEAPRTTIDRIDLARPGEVPPVRLANLDHRDLVLGAVDGGLLLLRADAGAPEAVVAHVPQSGVLVPRFSVPAVLGGALSGRSLYLFGSVGWVSVLRAYDLRTGAPGAALPVPPHHRPRSVAADPHDPLFVYTTLGWDGAIRLHGWDAESGTHQDLVIPGLPLEAVRTAELPGGSVAWRGVAGPRPVLVACEVPIHNPLGGAAVSSWLDAGGQYAAVRPPEGGAGCAEALAQAVHQLVADGRAAVGRVILSGDAAAVIGAMREVREAVAGGIIEDGDPPETLPPGPLLWLTRAERAPLRQLRRAVGPAVDLRLVTQPLDSPAAWGARLGFLGEVGGLRIAP